MLAVGKLTGAGATAARTAVGASKGAGSKPDAGADSGDASAVKGPPAWLTVGAIATAAVAGV